jgi:5-methylcytosine-specific restriction enzyme subunit McrC
VNSKGISVDLFEHDSRSTGEAPLVENSQWDEFNVFLEDIWRCRPQWGARCEPEDDPNQDEEHTSRKVKQRYLTRDSDGYLKAGRFVGTVCFEDVTVNIWPQVFRKQFEDALSDRSRLCGLMTRNVLRWASRAGYLRLHPSRGDSSVPPDVLNFAEAYLWLFAGFARDLLVRQPYWQYQPEIEEGGVLRGRLVMNQYINDCLTRGRWHKLVYEHEPFVHDNLLNRIIKRTCKLARGISNLSQVHDKLDEILFELEEVEDVFCTARDCDRVHFNRLQAEYGVVLDACRMILSHCQADNSGREMKRFCFLLPMDRLFEEYLRVLAQETVQENRGWKLVDKDGSGIFLAKGYQPPTSEQGYDCFTLRHDFLFKADSWNGNGVIIADAKWKCREEKAKYGNNFGVSQGDMYQMVAYAHGRGSTEVRLLYPAMGEALTSNHIATLTTKPGGNSAGSPINVQVHELKIHADAGPNPSEGEHYTEVEKAIKDAFKNMLKIKPEVSAH